MVKENVIEKFKIIYSEIEKEKGNTYLFMIIKMDEFIDKWSVFISASWIKAEDLQATSRYIVDKIRKKLTQEEGSLIARIGVLTPDERFVKLITSTAKVADDSPIRLKDTIINGYKIHDTWIYRSKSPQE